MPRLNHRDLTRRRWKAFDEAKAIMDKVHGRDLTAAECKVVDSHIAEIRVLDAQIETLKKDEAMKSREAVPYGTEGHMQLKDANGHNIPVLRKGQPFAALAERSEADEVPLAGLVKAMCTNDWRGLPAQAKSMSAGTGISGGLLIGQETSAQIVDLVRNKARCFQAGVMTLPMPAGNLTLARLDSDVTPAWRGENQTIANSDAAFGAVQLSAKSLAVNVKMSLELASFASNASDALMHSISEAMALAMDAAILSGSGIGREPLGIINQPGILTQDCANHYLTDTGYGWDPFGAALGQLRARNLDETSDSLSLLVSPGIATAQDRLVDTLGRSIVPPPYMESIPRMVTNQIPVATGTPNTSWGLMGKFDSIVCGIAQNIVLEMSREAGDASASAWTSGQIWLRAMCWMDVAVLRPAHFCQIQKIGLA
ncbi:Phage major capsid protein [Paramagnetospirillum magnetotacticum MS-1]|uniref:Phage major capsid protein n=1 Tax=Paramagnetospirillum magnetotacticum MS-1 TaxID=272627 RepID=A0A0C2YZT7_PARME|nr:phage major capsid protein [Paramagnetospirillum magnetotacticum]KIM00146.1 Phage major capsid protein [Paramagnetospirillum magnetotacticum MS-1]